MLTNKELDAKVIEIELLEAQIKNLKAMVDSLKGDLKNTLDESKLDCIDTGLNKIWYQPVEKSIVDTKALKADGLYEKYSKKNDYLQFKLTKSK